MNVMELRNKLRNARIRFWVFVILFLTVLTSIIMRVDFGTFVVIFGLCVPGLLGVVQNGLEVIVLKTWIREKRTDEPSHINFRFNQRLSWICGVLIAIILPLRLMLFWTDGPVIAYPKGDPTQARVVEAGVHVIPVFTHTIVQYRNFAFERVVEGYPALVISCQISENHLLLHELYGNQAAFEKVVKQKVDSAFVKLDSAHLALTFSPNDDVRRYQYLADANRIAQELLAITIRGCRQITARNVAVW